MDNSTWLRLAIKKLEQAGIGTARLDALVLLEDVMGVDRARLLAEPSMELSAARVAKLEKLLKRRVRHEPLAYVRGKTEFYGRTFVINHHVLEPRPESEPIIELLKGLVADDEFKPYKPRKPKIADVGAGSGALGITAALEVPNCVVELLDIDPKALKVAKTNVDKFTLNISVIDSDLLASSGKDYDILLCNLPYVPDGQQINLAASHEPELAIFGGSDGLEVYRKLFSQITKLTMRPLYLLSECLPPQHDSLTKIASSSGYKLVKTDDFIQLFRLA